MSATAESPVKMRERNAMLLGYLESDEVGLQKRAVNAVNAFTRTTMREESFSRLILEPLPITNDELDPQIYTDKPLKVIEKEPGQPPAISVPFANLPINFYIMSERYPVTFGRILSPRFTKDIAELRTYAMDIRKVLSDNALKDMLAEEDGRFIQAVNAAVGTKDVVNPLVNTPLYQSIPGGITRETVVDAFKIMNLTRYRLEAHTCLCNFVTWKEFMKWGRDEVGGDLSQDIVKNGMNLQEFLGKRWIVTIKTDLVPVNEVYMFADPKFIGKSFILEDTTLYIKREHFMLEMFFYETIGATIGHVGGLARASFE
ncbi:MAG: hypothetical protein QW463_08005 [Candidatus Caldarchaeum sp.]